MLRNKYRIHRCVQMSTDNLTKFQTQNHNQLWSGVLIVDFPDKDNLLLNIYIALVHFSCH